jgi:hypothetical protein
MTRQPCTLSETDTTASPSGWYPENLAQIQRTLDSLHQQDDQSRLAAVFDFDNTCICGDIGRSVFRCQAQTLSYRIDPPTLAELLPVCEAAIDGQDLTLIRQQLISDYTLLYPFLAEGRPEEALTHPGQARFSTLLLWYAAAARRVPQLGSGFVVQLMAQLLAGHTTAEMAALTDLTIEQLLGEPLGQQRCQAEFPPPIGTIEAGFDTGIRAYDEMIDLMHLLTRHQIDCQVISASSGPLVQAAVTRFAFPVAAEHIFGIRLTPLPEGIFAPEPLAGYPLTYRSGKAEVIHSRINGQVILVAGDADTDYEMLTLPDIPLRLLINRNSTGLISTLYEHPDYLLQGLDTGTGSFRPERTTC